MKVLLLSGLLFISTLTSEKSNCDNIQLDITITHSSQGSNNGKIEVEVKKGKAPFRAYLFADDKSNNLHDVALDELVSLSAGSYILVIQDANNCSVHKKIKLK